MADAAAKLRFPADLFYSDRKMGTFSGGEKVKLRMALLTLRRPDCYLLDEPSNDLDIETLEWLESFIRECPQPVLYISHDEMLLENTANVIIHLEQLRRKTLPRYTVARMGYRRYVEERLSKFAHQEQVAKKEREEERKRQEKLRKIEQKVQHQLDNIAYSDRDHVGKMLKKKMKSVKSMEHRFDREREDMTEFPRQRGGHSGGLWPGHGGARGQDGGGLLPAAAGGRRGAAGPEHPAVCAGGGARVHHWEQRGGENYAAAADRERIAAPAGPEGRLHAPRDYGETVDQGQTPVEFLAKSGEKEELTRVKTYLGSMKYTPEEQGHSIAELSGGQKAKLFFLKMILDGANVLVLDEPTRNFSPLSGPVIRGILRDFPGCIISVSHDRRYIGEACGTLYRMTPGGLVEEENVWEEE